MDCSQVFVCIFIVKPGVVYFQNSEIWLIQNDHHEAHVKYNHVCNIYSFLPGRHEIVRHELELTNTWAGSVNFIDLLHIRINKRDMALRILINCLVNSYHFLVRAIISCAFVACLYELISVVNKVFARTIDNHHIWYSHLAVCWLIILER